MTRARRHAQTLLAAILLATPAAAENLLQNPQFDADLTGWNNYGTTPTWSDDDRHGSATSGSMAIVAGGDIPVGAFQCILLPGEGVYELATDHVRAIGSSTAWAWISVTWYSGTDCTTGNLGSESDFVEASSEWQRLKGEWSTESGTQSARVVLYSQDTGLGPELHFDDTYFGVPVIFEDGFESGDTSRWTSTLP